MTNKELQFIGLFLGEGYCGLIKYTRKCIKRGFLYQPKMSITQRYDNKATIDWVKDNFGGHVYKGQERKQQNGYTSQATFIWIDGNITRINKLTNLLLKSDIPNTKLNSIRVVNEFCKWKIKRGLHRHYTEEDLKYMETLRQRCLKNNQFGISRE